MKFGNQCRALPLCVLIVCLLCDMRTHGPTGPTWIVSLTGVPELNRRPWVGYQYKAGNLVLARKKRRVARGIEGGHSGALVLERMANCWTQHPVDSVQPEQGLLGATHCLLRLTLQSGTCWRGGCGARPRPVRMHSQEVRPRCAGAQLAG